MEVRPETKERRTKEGIACFPPLDRKRANGVANSLSPISLITLPVPLNYVAIGARGDTIPIPKNHNSGFVGLLEELKPELE